MAEDAEDIIDLDAPGAAAPAAAAAAAAEADVVDLDADAPGALPPGATLLTDGSVLLPLRFPVTLKFRQGGQVREETTQSLLLHRLTGADMRAVGAASKDSFAMVAVARMARAAELKFSRIFDAMDGADVAAALRVLDFFFAPGPRTGR